MINLPLLILARICTTAVYMTYPACIHVLLDAWNMSAAQGGMVQGAFTGAFAVSLLGASYLCDRVGAKLVFNVATLLTGGAALVFAALAYSFETALIGAALVGFAQGGTYTPAIILASAYSPSGRSATAIGWVLAGMSAGYVVSIFLSTALLGLYGYPVSFWITGALTIFGWVFGSLSTRMVPDFDPGANNSARSPSRREDNRRARLLVVGYIGHCWELFGTWAWLPTFLGAALLAGTDLSPVQLGLWIALIIHASGFFASFLSGIAADRFGAKCVLIAFAALGTLCTATVGWLPESSLGLLLAVSVVCGFATIGDSAVLSSAIAATVPSGRLGSVLGIRSVLGIGAASFSPIVFGAALDMHAGTLGWGLAFSALALGGAVATVCAVKL